jgi:hypothetical protein
MSRPTRASARWFWRHDEETHAAMTQDPSRAYEAIELELLEEKAATLARAAERLEAALAALAAAETDPAATPGRAELIEEAAEALWFVVVQREAIGLTAHDEVFRIYGVPERVRRFMGPRRRGR